MSKLTFKDRTFYIDGKETKLIVGDMHYFRIHQTDWEKRLDLAVDFGLNVIQTYVPWNMHEPKKGEFCFEGMLDLKKYLQLAQSKGLYVFLRPSPYICSEWDFGGLPWWLLKDKDMVIRSSDENYLKHVEEYYKVLFEEIKPCFAENGGNIIAVAVENEYGSYGNDRDYIERLAEIIKENGVKEQLYTTDGDLSYLINFGRYKKDSFTGMNYRATTGTSKHAFDVTTELDPDKPFFVGEFWAGRAMHWGEPFKRRNPAETSEGFKEALNLGGNVSFYMFSGGTNFGFMGGANNGYSYSARPGTPSRYIPHTTSYDVDALVLEDGTVADKYFLCRDCLDEYLGKEKRPHTAPPHPVQALTVGLTEKAEFFKNLDILTVKEVKSPLPKSMEELDQAYGVVVYETEIQGFVDNPRVLEVDGVKDRAAVFKDGEWIATFVRERETTVADGYERSGKGVKFAMNGEKIKITALAENLGRINYGSLMPTERKGIARFGLSGPTLFGVKSKSIELENRKDTQFEENTQSSFHFMQPVFLKGTFDADAKADTYVDFSDFGHGYVYINGFNLGRFDSAGPVMTLYVPHGILKEKDNLIEVVDFAPTKFNGKIELIDKHILDAEAEQLH